MELLVSVRNLQEAELAVQCGVDIVDVKEPRRGSLGAASDDVVMAISARLAARCRLSLAMGELTDWNKDAIAAPCLSGYTYTKLGLAGCATMSDWRKKWLAWSHAVRHTSGPVAVAYADYRQCAAPHPQDVVLHAVEVGAAAFLIDTCHKGSGNLLDHWSPCELQRLATPLRQSGIPFAVAGALNRPLISRLGSTAPDIVGVRGAACQNSLRAGALSARRIHQLQQVIQMSRAVTQ